MPEFRDSKSYNARVPKRNMRNAGIFVVWFCFFPLEKRLDTLVGAPGLVGRDLVSLCPGLMCLHDVSVCHNLDGFLFLTSSTHES